MVLNSITKLKTRKATIFLLMLVIPSLIQILPENVLADSVVAAVPVGSGPIGVVFDSANGDIYVTNHSSNSVSVINGTTNRVVATIHLGSLSYPSGVAFDSANGDIYVTNYPFNSVSVINDTTNTVVATIPFGSSTFGVAFDPANGDIYVTNHSSNSVSVIQTHSCC